MVNAVNKLITALAIKIVSPSIDRLCTNAVPELTPIVESKKINPICCKVTFTLKGRFQTIGPVRLKEPRTSPTISGPPAYPNLNSVVELKENSTLPSIRPRANPKPKENRLTLLVSWYCTNRTGSLSM